MKRFGIISAALLLACANTKALDSTFTNHVNTLIHDYPDAGSTLTNTIDVTGIAGWITNVTVSLNVTGGRSGDYYVYLACDNGGYAVLLNRVGRDDDFLFGFDDEGLNLDLDTHAAADVHGAYAGGTGPLTGAWQPDGRDVSPQVVVDADERTALLTSFNNRIPNGRFSRRSRFFPARQPAISRS